MVSRDFVCRGVENEEAVELRTLLMWRYVPKVKKDTIKRRIFLAARDGMPRMMFAMLENVPRMKRKQYAEQMIKCNGNYCTPLIIAAMKNHINVVKMLLHNFQVDIEQEGTVDLDDYCGMRGATALWCAAALGHLNVVRYLVTHGADVNHSTVRNSTPLRAACFVGHLDVIRYLVEHGADVNIANENDNTCLMLSSHKGHLGVVKYLISQKMDLNARAKCGGTAMHFAAEYGHVSVVKELLKSGAKITKDNIGITPFFQAAERAQANVVEYLIELPCFSKGECIEALELLAASYANNDVYYSLNNAFYYMERAMKMRTSDPKTFMPKRCLPRMQAYDNRMECQTMEELQSIRHDRNALHMESLLMRERILGPKNPYLPHLIIRRGLIFKEGGQFDKCLNLWLHALRLKSSNEIAVIDDISRLARLFARMLNSGQEVHLYNIKDVLQIAVKELRINILLNQNSNDDTFEELNFNIHSTLFLLVISAKIIQKYSPEDQHEFYKLVYQINKLQLVARHGSSLLHLAVNAYTPANHLYRKDSFPCAATARMLIQCGANVNAVDDDGNTPLHIIAARHTPNTDFETLHSIINLLVHSGAHIDCANKNGRTPSDVVLSSNAYAILKTLYSFRLKCLAAKAVQKYQLQYEKVIPTTLVAFTDMHGVPRK